MEDTLSKLYHYSPLYVLKAKHAEYEQKLEKQDVMIDKRALLGIEIEVENVPKYFEPEFYWQSKEDHSLRNNGREFVSIPLRGAQVPYAIDYLKGMIDIYNPEYDFNPRTSVHVHLNVRDMTWGQVKTLVLLYAIFERHFFHLAGTKREESIFCVPLYKTNQLRDLPNIETNLGNWHKYNALNLCTLLGANGVGNYGTVEFRHLYGTLDKQILVDWINNILCLRNAATSISYEDVQERIKRMNSTSEYIVLYEAVFGQYADLRKMVKRDFESCVSYTKQALWGKDGLMKFPPRYESSLATALKKPAQAEAPITDIEVAAAYIAKQVGIGAWDIPKPKKGLYWTNAPGPAAAAVWVDDTEPVFTVPPQEPTPF